MTIKASPPDSPPEEKKPKKKTVKKEPSLRQKKVLDILGKKMGEKGGKINKGEILEEAGYSPTVKATPDKVFGTASMKRAIKSVGLDPRSLKIKHKQLLNSGRIECVNANMNIPADQFTDMFLKAMPGSSFLNFWDNPFNFTRMFYFIIPDTITQAKVLDMAYKINGEYAPEKHDHKVDVIAPIVYIPDNNRSSGPPPK